MGLMTAFINPVGPLAAGWIRDQTGSYEQAFTIFAFLFLAAIVMMLIATPPVLRAAPVRYTVRQRPAALGRAHRRVPCGSATAPQTRGRLSPSLRGC